VVVGRTSNVLCPVKAVLNYLVMMGRGPGLLFRFQDGKLVTRGRLVEQVQNALQKVGINSTSTAVEQQPWQPRSEYRIGQSRY